jgi:hypothetical protein
MVTPRDERWSNFVQRRSPKIGIMRQKRTQGTVTSLCGAFKPFFPDGSRGCSVIGDGGEATGGCAVICSVV